MKIEHTAKTTAYRVCAWCGSLIGVKSWPSVWEESTVTHGVCESCKEGLRCKTRQLPSVNDRAAQRRVDPKARVRETRRIDRSEPAPVW